MVHCVLSTRRLVKGQVFDARAGSAGHAASNVSLKPLSLPARGDDQKLAGLDAIPRTGGHCTNAPLHACHPSGQPDSRDPAVEFEALDAGAATAAATPIGLPPNRSAQGVLAAHTSSDGAIQRTA